MRAKQSASKQGKAEYSFGDVSSESSRLTRLAKFPLLARPNKNSNKCVCVKIQIAK
jgi:hypothetical protein